ncbi:MAG: transposase [Desulfovibrionaceae bacterium]|nr:transposase [Desulfovibrionaceae bacterium]
MSLQTKLLGHRQNIRNAIKYQANSSQSERCNALIKTLIRIGKGFRNLANLTALILLKCSQVVIPLANTSSRERLELINRAREYRLEPGGATKARCPGWSGTDGECCCLPVTFMPTGSTEVPDLFGVTNAI